MPPREKYSGDHLGRSDKDFAIEHAEYMAQQAERVIREVNQSDGNERVMVAPLMNAIRAFRKRAARAGHKPSADRLKD